MIKHIATLIIIMLTLSSMASATEVSGDVWGVWESSMNPIEVVGDLRVPPDSALFIGPGCFIEFQDRYHLLVDVSGVLQANGVEGDSIIFTAADTTLGWGSIRFLSADSGSQISYSRIEHSHGTGEHEGGAVYCEYSYLELRNSLIQQNSGIYGGIANLRYNHRIIFENNLITANTGSVGIHSHRNTDIEIIGNTFTQNDQMSVIDIYGFYNCSATIADNIFYNNNGSIIMVIDASNTLVERNIIHDNICAVFLSWQGSGPTLYRENIIYNNHCPWGGPGSGGIFTSEDSEYLVENNTIVNNSGVNGSYLGWIGEEHSTNSPVVFKNNIIWGNVYFEDSLIYVDAPNFSLNYCDIQAGWSGYGNIIADPMFVDSANGDFHLMPGSPCIDTGDPNSPLDPDSTRADMGALPFDQTTSIEHHFELPTRTALAQNYPNPFNAQTLISFDLLRAGDVSLEIYDILGKKVATLTDGFYPAGSHEIVWEGLSGDGEELSSGIYFYRIKAETFTFARKMLMIK